MNNVIKNIKDKKQSGFTLMEMMVVIAIISILSAIAIPRLLNPENKARKAARELMGNMQKTRTSAIKNYQTWAIVFVPATNNYYICSDPGADGVWSTVTGSADPADDNTIEQTINFTEYATGIQYGSGPATTNASGGAVPADVSYTSDVLTFNPQGLCGAGYVYLSYGDVAYAVGTLETGIIRIKRWTGGAWR